MNTKLILSVALCFVFTSAAFAQSGSKNRGYSSKGSSSRTSYTKADRETLRAKDKLVSQMTRKDFESVRLTKNQKQTLSQMVDSKYSMIAQFDSKIASLIPATKASKLKKAFREAKKEGSSEVEAMSKSMEMIGLSEDVREQVLSLNESKESVKEAIRTSVVQTFDQEQQEAFAAAMATKKEMMAKEEGMSGKDEMSGKKMADENEGQKDKGKEMAASGSNSK